MSFNSPRRPDLELFLSNTDQPLILAELMARWSDDPCLPNRIVTDVGIANPHLAPPDSGMNVVLLAVAKDRQDLLDFTQADTVDALLRGTRLPGADLADKYRRVLRALPPGVARECLCKIVSAGMGREEAIAAATEAGYTPEQLSDRVLFLYLTEQWDRYDTVDPTGDLLYGAYLEVQRSAAADAKRHHSFDLGAHGLTGRIIDTARRNGRSDPAARYLDENPLARSKESDDGRNEISGERLFGPRSTYRLLPGPPTPPRKAPEDSVLRHPCLSLTCRPASRAVRR